jgi:F-type H+-transporting ATPase subunit b
MTSFLIFAASGFTEVRPGLIFWTLVTFILVALVLRAKAWKPVLDLVAERENQIKKAIETAQHERAEAERLLAEQKAVLAEARRGAAEMMRRNQADVERFREELMAKSRQEAEQLKADAQKVIQEEKARAIAEVRAVAVDLAIEIAAKLIDERLDDAKQRALAQEFIEQLPQADGKGGRPTL